MATPEAGKLPSLRERFDVRRVLGEGSVARTLLAWDRQRGEEVAVKVLYPARMASSRDFDRFEAEASALARLQHAAIPRYVDHFAAEEESSPVYCLVQAYRSGQTLQNALDEGRRFSEAEVIALALEVLDVLVYLADQAPPVVHRDIKPDNLILEAQGRVALVDFGGVREAVRQTIRAGSTVIGTYGFMPPEQFAGQVTLASDLFALGVTLLCALTRRGGASLSTDGFNVDVDAMQLNVSVGLRDVLRALVATRLEERYHDPLQVQEDLRLVQGGQAPRHVLALRSAALRRRRLEESERRARLQRTTGVVVRLVFYALVLLALGAVGASYLALSQALQEAVVAFLVLSLFAVLLSLTLIGRAYLSQHWEAPSGAWIEAVYRVERWVPANLNAHGQQMVYRDGHYDPNQSSLCRLVRGGGGVAKREFAYRWQLPVGSEFRMLVHPQHPDLMEHELSPVEEPLPGREQTP